MEVHQQEVLGEKRLVEEEVLVDKCLEAYVDHCRNELKVVEEL